MLHLDKQDFGSAFFYPENSQQYRNSFGYSDSKPSVVVADLNHQQNNNRDLQHSYSFDSNDKSLGDMFIYEPNAVVDEKSPSKIQNLDFLSLDANEFEPNKQSDLRYSDLRSQSASTNNENSGDGNEFARVEEIDRNSNGRSANRVPPLDGEDINLSEDMNGIETIKPQVSTSSSSINSQAAKRQTAGIVASALRNLALGLSDQFNNALGLVTKQDKSTSVNKDNKTDQINNPNSKNSNNESLVAIQSQPIKAQNKRQLINTENNKWSKWSKLRNSEKPSVSLGSNKDEVYQTEGIDDSEDDEQRQTSEESKLVGKYLYAPTNHFHFAMKPVKSVDENDNDVHDDEDVQQSSRGLLATQKLLPKSYASKRLVDETSESGDDGVRDAIFSSTSGNTLDSNGVTRKLLNKVSSNDIYFLVMVVALCASASTIVLAAGFFVYNQQMIKKRSDEGEAPTYGLVGPSSLGGSSKNSDNLASNIFVSSTGANNCVIVPKDAAALKASENVKSKLQQCNGTILANGKNENLLIHKFGNPFVTQANSNKEVFLAGQNSATMYHYQHQKQQMITSVSDRASSQQTSASDLDSEDENDEENYTVYECPGLASAHNMEIKNPLFHDDNTPANSPPVVRKK